MRFDVGFLTCAIDDRANQELPVLTARDQMDKRPIIDGADDVLGSVLVTGGTGIVGWSIVNALHELGQQVRVMARAVEATRAVLPYGVEVVAGDLGNQASLMEAVSGCDTVFHAAGMPEQWLRDPGRFYRVNVEGTRALVEAALRVQTRAFVYTSTVDVFAHQPGVRYNESVLASAPLGTAYERSKQLADHVVADAVRRGLPARFIHPAAVFGPSPTRTPGLNDVITKLAIGRLPALPPGGLPVVYAPDVARGQIAAAAAEVGSRYILCDRYVSFRELADVINRLTRSRRPPQLPVPVARAVSTVMEAASGVTHRAPLLPRGQLQFMTAHHLPDATRAATELRWTPTSLDGALTATITYRNPLTAQRQYRRSSDAHRRSTSVPMS
jgi:dihydroflavonol-4-reductase